MTEATNKQLAELVSLSAKATQGKWLVERLATNFARLCHGINGSIADFSRWIAGEQGDPAENQANAEFVAFLVNWFRANIAALQHESTCLSTQELADDFEKWCERYQPGALKKHYQNCWEAATHAALRREAECTPMSLRADTAQAWKEREDCPNCKGRGQIAVGHSGDESDGNAPIFEQCADCEGTGKREPLSGMMMVPREPTQEMVQIGYERYRTDNLYHTSYQARIRGIYSAMLSAAEAGKEGNC